MELGRPLYHRAPRYPLAAPVEIPEGQGRCRNLSTSGMYVEIGRPLEAGAIVSLSLALDALPTMPPVELCAEGRVVRVEPLEGRTGVGIEFRSIRFENADTRSARSPA